ncbi:MAG: HAD family hydrolase [Chloroflexota bacterium]
MITGFDRDRIQALLFDLDGTLADTDDLWVQRLAGLLAHVLSADRAARLARRWLMTSEGPANAAFAAADRLGLDNLAAPLLAALHVLRGESRPGRFLVVPGVPEALLQLHRRYPMAIVTSREAHSTRQFLETFSLAPLFQCVATGRTCWRTKPHPAPVQWAARQLGLAPDECLVVGDTTVDIRAGRAAGAQTAGVLCGFGQRDDLERAGAHLILETTADLPQVLFGKAHTA